MSKVIATITTSVDGFFTGPNDGPGCGLGVGGEQLHYWVMGGPWTYETEHEPGVGMSDADREFFDELTDGLGAGICGRGMYDSAEAWGGTNPFEGPLWVVTHRVEEAPPPESGFTFIDGLESAMAAATAAAACCSASAATRSGPWLRRRRGPVVISPCISMAALSAKALQQPERPAQRAATVELHQGRPGGNDFSFRKRPYARGSTPAER